MHYSVIKMKVIKLKLHKMYDFKIFFFQFLDNKKDIFIHDVYKINETSENVDTVSYGRWNPKSGMNANDLNIWGRRSNLKGFMFR